MTSPRASPQLDKLFLEYLNTLDTYQSQVSELSKALSDGYLDLAKANFHTSGGVRYGRDSFDQRMTASRRVSITPSLAGVGLGLKVVELSETSDGGAHQQNKVEAFPGGDDGKPTLPVIPGDPIRWFGILVPQALRSAQASFVKGLETVFPLMTTLATLRSLETKIDHLRHVEYVFKVLVEPLPQPLPNVLPLSQLDKESGFIHLSTESQVPSTIERFVEGEELWALKIAYEMIAEDVRWEADAEDADAFPHLYAELELSGAIEVAKLMKFEGGRGDSFTEARWENLQDLSTGKKGCVGRLG